MKCHRQSGQALVFVAFSLIVLTGVVGLSIDMGYLRYTKRRLQTAADSAAIAGASELKNGNYRTAALNDSKTNGFQDGVKGVSVDVSNPPKDPPFSGTAHANYVEVQVQQNAPTYFMRIFGVNSAPLSARAVAYLGSAKGCIYALGLLGGINLNADVNAPGCGVVDNALLTIGRGCLNASSIGIVLNLLGGGCTNPQPILGIAPADDPLGYLIPPAPGACNFTNTTINSNTATTLNPGTYCGGIRIANTNRGPVTFQPGLYFLNGGGLQAAGTGAVNGAGVTFYVTGGGSLQMTGTGNINLTAPTNAPAAGIPPGVLFFQDRGDAQNANVTNGNVFFTGALYFPGAPLTLAGNHGTPYLIIVARTLHVDGALTIGTDYSSLSAGSPIKSAVLVQ